jgi:DNA-3-methyladenine glycosylase II
MLQKAKKHLSKDPLFIPILESIEIKSFENADSEVNIMTSLIKPSLGLVCD